MNNNKSSKEEDCHNWDSLRLENIIINIKSFLYRYDNHIQIYNG